MSAGPDAVPVNDAAWQGKAVDTFAQLAPSSVFLACDESRFVTGGILGVTGGMLLA